MLTSLGGPSIGTSQYTFNLHNICKYYKVHELVEYDSIDDVSGHTVNEGVTYETILNGEATEMRNNRSIHTKSENYERMLK